VSSNQPAAFVDLLTIRNQPLRLLNRYKEIHQQYLALFEGKIEDFLESENCTTEGFYKECAEVQGGGHSSWFVDMLLGAIDYKYFYGLMLNEARRQQTK
jgi:hypothetical protein